MGRLAQAVVGTGAARLLVYVDDPILIVAGNVVEQQELICLSIFVLRVVNLKLAYQKEQYGRWVDWIGTSLQFDNSGVLATLKHETRSELQELTARSLQKNAVFYPQAIVRPFSFKAF